MLEDIITVKCDPDRLRPYSLVCSPVRTCVRDGEQQVGSHFHMRNVTFQRVSKLHLRQCPAAVNRPNSAL